MRSSFAFASLGILLGLVTTHDEHSHAVEW